MTSNASSIASLVRQARPEVVDAIRQASSSTGVDFSYLLQKAATESSFDTKAQASTSSARGLYQFVDRTWLDTVDRHGAKHGLVNAAAAIERDRHGNPIVNDGATRERILALRDDPRVAAMMAAELAQDNQASLESSLGRKVGNTELYLAHFLGAGGAAKFLSSMDADPGLKAAQVMPDAARANEGVFYQRGKSLTVDQVFARFANKFDAGSPNPYFPPGAQPALAQAANVAAPLAADEPHFAAAPDPAIAEALTATAKDPANRASGTGVFDHRLLPTRVPMQTLPVMAMRIIESLSLPGESERNSQQDWHV